MKHLNLALECVGIAAIIYGVFLWCVPAAFLVGGLALILLAMGLSGVKK
jgi:hypothetical protein